LSARLWIVASRRILTRVPDNRAVRASVDGLFPTSEPGSRTERNMSRRVSGELDACGEQSRRASSKQGHARST
jgi:hypothetical protein